MKKWEIEKLTGYKPMTTFYEDFGIAEMFGSDAIVDTYHRAFNEWKDNYKYLTELSLVLNWKSWEYYKTDEDTARLYDKLWKEVDKYAGENLKDEEQNYYFITTD